MPTKKPFPGKKPERKEQTAAQSALTSPYNVMFPLFAAEHVYVAHPTSRKLLHCSTASVTFLSLMKELVDLGVGARLLREFEEFTAYDARWAAVAVADDLVGGVATTNR